MQDWYKIREISKDVFMIEETGHVHSFLVNGDNKSMLIDTGMGMADFKKGITPYARNNITVLNTHWHFDHVWGLGLLGDAASHVSWPPIELYLPHEVTYHFDQELAYMKSRVNLHPIGPGDRFELPDATWEVVKTTHNEHSVGFIVEASQRFAYLVDGVTPPVQTLERLKKTNLDFVILEATMDELDEQWGNFTVEQAVDCWQQIGTERCILTHLTCHSWKNHQLIAGLSYKERLAYEAKTPGLKFAYDGMMVIL